MMEKIESLLHWLGEHQRLVVAYSGGVDSSLVLAAAVKALPNRVTAVLAVSPSLPSSERAEARALAQSLDVRLEEVETQEVEDPRYAANPANRCYFCKEHVYRELAAIAKSHEDCIVVDGMNADDTMDLRPGRAAARELGVRSPLHELGFSKQDVRDAARALGLANWDKPAAACLASRIPYGSPITPALLSQVENAEAALKHMGFHELRVRHHGDLARIEVPLAHFTRILAAGPEINQALHACGYTYTTLDLQGLRSGSSNEVFFRKP